MILSILNCRSIGEEGFAKDIFEDYVMKLQEKLKEKDRRRDEEKVNNFMVHQVFTFYPNLSCSWTLVGILFSMWISSILLVLFCLEVETIACITLYKWAIANIPSWKSYLHIYIYIVQNAFSCSYLGTGKINLQILWKYSLDFLLNLWINFWSYGYISK